MFNTSSFASPQNLNRTNFNNDSVCYTDSDDEDDLKWKSRPVVWVDDVRMNALFAPFRNRDLNPLHYDNKLKFWKESILNYCREKQIIQFDLAYLENAFRRKNIKPKCLELVLNELAKEKSISTRDEVLKPKPGLIQNIFTKLVWSPLAWSTSYLFKSVVSYNSTSTSTTSYYSSSYTLSSPKSGNSLESSFNKIQSSPTKEDTPNKTYVLPELVEFKAQELLKQLHSSVVYKNIDCVIEYEKLIDQTREFLKETDLELILKFLEVNQKVLIIDSNVVNRKLVKFSVNSSQNVQPLNEIEISYLKLKEIEKKLELEADKLTAQIEQLNANIKAQLVQGNKSTALKFLKKRKTLEKSLDGKDSILNNIESMIMSIQQADTNQATLDVYTKGLSAIKEANKGINIDQIDDTMYEIQDICNQNNEIEEALAKSPMSNKYSFDEKELTAELNELLAQENQENSFNMDDILKNLPQIPNDTPQKATASSSLKASQLSIF